MDVDLVSFYNTGMLSFAYLKDSDVQVMEVLKWTLARYSSIMNLGMLSFAYLKDSGVQLMEVLKWMLPQY